MSYECGDIAKTYVAAAQASNGPAAAAALEALQKAGGCGLLSHVTQQAPPPEFDSRFVARGATPMLDQTVAACDQQPEACATVVDQLRTGTSSQAVAALYSNAIQIGLEIGVMMGTAVFERATNEYDGGPPFEHGQRCCPAYSSRRRPCERRHGVSPAPARRRLCDRRPGLVHRSIMEPTA